MEIYPIVLASPATTDGGVTSDFIRLRDKHRVCIVAVFNQAVGHATGIDLVQATNIFGTDAKPITNAVPIWANEDGTGSPVMVRQADAITYNVAPDAKSKIVTMDIDPAGLDVAGGFNCIGVTVDDSSVAANLVSVLVLSIPRYT